MNAAEYQHKRDVLSLHLPLYGLNSVAERGDLSSHINHPHAHRFRLARRLFPHCINPGSLLRPQEPVKLLKLLFDRLLRLLSLKLWRNTFSIRAVDTQTTRLHSRL